MYGDFNIENMGLVSFSKSDLSTTSGLFISCVFFKKIANLVVIKSRRIAIFF